MLKSILIAGAMALAACGPDEGQDAQANQEILIGEPDGSPWAALDALPGGPDEISAEQYIEIRKLLRARPDLEPLIAQAMLNDGWISQAEYLAIGEIAAGEGAQPAKAEIIS